MSALKRGRGTQGMLGAILAFGAILSPIILMLPGVIDAIVSLPLIHLMCLRVMFDAIQPFGRSVLAGILGVFLALILARLAAPGLAHLHLSTEPSYLSWRTRLLGASAIPFLTGSISCAFLLHNTLINYADWNPIANTRFFSISILLDAAIHGLLYAPLLVWMLHLNALESPRDAVSYLKFYAVRSTEVARSYYWPRFRILALLLSLFIFLDCYQESIFLTLLEDVPPIVES